MLTVLSGSIVRKPKYRFQDRRECGRRMRQIVVAIVLVVEAVPLQAVAAVSSTVAIATIIDVASTAVSFLGYRYEKQTLRWKL